MTSDNDIGMVSDAEGAYLLNSLEEDAGVATAFNSLLNAANQGHVQSQARLGIMYRDGRGGVPQDYTVAGEWLRKATKNGHAFTKNALDHMHSEGKGMPQDYATAGKWWHKAVKQALAIAKVILELWRKN